MEKWKNNAESLLDADIADSDLALAVSSGDGALFPTLSAGDYFWLTLSQGATIEIVKVTARASDAFTIERGKQGTAAAAFTAGATVEQRITAETLNDLAAFREAAGWLAPPLEPDSMDDDFLGSALDGKWTAGNLSTTTVTVDGSVVTLKPPASSTNNLRYYVQAIPNPTGAWEYRLKLWMDITDAAAQLCGFIVKENSTGKILVFAIGRFAAGTQLWSGEYSSDTAFTGAISTFDLSSFRNLANPIEFRVRRSGTNVIGEWRYGGGGAWIQLFSRAEATSFTTRGDRVGFFVNQTANLASQYASFDRFIRVA